MPGGGSTVTPATIAQAKLQAAHMQQQMMQAAHQAAGIGPSIPQNALNQGGLAGPLIGRIPRAADAMIPVVRGLVSALLDDDPAVHVAPDYNANSDDLIVAVVRPTDPSLKPGEMHRESYVIPGQLVHSCWTSERYGRLKLYMQAAMHMPKKTSWAITNVASHLNTPYPSPDGDWLTVSTVVLDLFNASTHTHMQIIQPIENFPNDELKGRLALLGE